MTMQPTRISYGNGWIGEIYHEWNFSQEIVEQWDRIASEYGDKGIFINYGWFDCWWKAFGHARKLFVVVLQKNGGTEAVFPLCTDGNNLTSITNAHTCHYDFIINPEIRQVAISMFIQLLEENVPNAQMYYELMTFNGENVILYFNELGCRRIPHHAYSQPWAPFLEVTGNWTEFYEKLPGRLRNTIRKNRKRAQIGGELRLEIIKSSEKIEDKLNIFFDIEYSSWKGRNGTAIRCNPEVETFYKLLSHWAAPRNQLLLFTLELNHTPISSYLCLSSGKTVFGIKLGYTESFSHITPGNLLFSEMFPYLFESSMISVFDFLGACDLWKMEWTEKSNNYGWLKVYPKSLTGWSRYIYQYGWKDLLKKTYLVNRISAWLTDRDHNKGYKRR